MIIEREIRAVGGNHIAGNGKRRRSGTGNGLELAGGADFTSPMTKATLPQPDCSVRTRFPRGSHKCGIGPSVKENPRRRLFDLVFTHHIHYSGRIGRIKRDHRQMRVSSLGRGKGRRRPASMGSVCHFSWLDGNASSRVLRGTWSSMSVSETLQARSCATISPRSSMVISITSLPGESGSCQGYTNGIGGGTRECWTDFVAVQDAVIQRSVRKARLGAMSLS